MAKDYFHRKDMVVIAGIFVVIGIVVSIVGIYNLYSLSNPFSGENTLTSSSLGYNPNVTYATVDEYIDLLKSYPKDIVDEYRILEPWFNTKCCGDTYKYLKKYNTIVNKIIGNCTGTLWEYYVRFIAYDTTWSSFAKLRRLYQVRTLENSSIRERFCSIDIYEAIDKATELYRVLSRDIITRYNSVKDKLPQNPTLEGGNCLLTLRMVNLRRLVNFTISGQNRSLEPNDLFFSIVHMIIKYILINIDIDVLMNTSIDKNLHIIFTNYSYVEEKYNATFDALRKLANITTWPDYIVLIVSHTATWLYIRTLEAIVFGLSESELLKKDIWLTPDTLRRFFVDDGNTCLRIEEMLFYRNAVERLYKVLSSR